MTYIKENIISKLQKLYSSLRNSRVGNKLPALFVKKPLCMGDLLPTCKIFIEKSGVLGCTLYCKEIIKLICFYFKI